jgi:type III restriction enzyme
MELKGYQTAALDRLAGFLGRARLTGAPDAYAHVTAGDDSLKGYASRYGALEGLPDVPYCCVRLPTGGGKTLLGAHAVKVAADRYVEEDRPLVLWLTPSKQIAEQTSAALKNPAHPYRQALDDAFGGAVRVLDIRERRLATPQDYADKVLVFVGTHQSFNVKDKEGRKVYQDDEAFEPHFGGALPPGLARNESGKRTGKVAMSFANLLRWHRPVLILDEAQNFVTGLSGEVKQRLNPSCVIEFTATPKPASNTIFNATARALRDADMIKLPIIMTAHQTWEAAVDGALATRRALAEAAASDPGPYLRPITLFQAQPATAGADATVDKLKTHLESIGVDPRTIAVATGNVRELDGIDLMRPDSLIEHVITVAALKEGWDCSFAYVFCSLANIGSEGAVEQLLGRVLRQPYAMRRANSALNQAYAHLSSQVFAATAEKLKDRLVEMGFDAPGEARALIVQEVAPLAGGGINRVAEPLDVAALPVEAQAAVRVERLAEGERLHIAAEATPAVAAAIAAEIERRQPGGKAKAAALLDWQAVNDARRAPAGLGVRFAPIPQMRLLVQGDLEPLDSQALIDFAGWTLADASPRLDAQQFDYDETAQVFRFDLDGEALSYTIGARDAELALDYGAAWDTAWLTMALDPRDRWHSSHSALLEFNRRVVTDLLERRGLPLGKLARGRYLLKRAVEQRIRASRLAAAGRGQETLFALPDDVVVTPDAAFRFDPLVNPATAFQEGSWTPERCYYSRMGKMNGPELDCAQALDTLPAVRHWVRNGDSGQHAFSLPLAGGNFFPDFVAELNDGRVFVVEHKMEKFLNDQLEREKDLVGRHWASRSGGRCRFVMVTQANGWPRLARQIAAALD